MSPLKQDIAIAEFMGFLDIHRGSRRGTRTELGNTLWGTKDAPSINYPREYSIIPSYGTNLNACHEFEKVLSTSPEYMQQHAFNNYAYLLIEMCKHQCNAVAATAAQRCEAFLKTINKWKND